MNVVMLMTDSNFDREYYGENSVQHQAKFFTRQVDQTKPSWIDMKLQINVFEDESSYLQYG